MNRYISYLGLCIVPFLLALQTTRFMVVADSHINSPVSNFDETILYEIVMAAIDEQLDFIFFPGDLIVRSFSNPAEEDSVLKDWRFVLDTLAFHDIRVFACRGNNDVSSKASWDSLFKGEYTLPQNGPEGEKNITYTLEFNNILFIALDQYTRSHRINQIWLDEILQNNTKTFVFATGHEPAFKLLHTNCISSYPAARDSLWESLIASGTIIYFCGHDHFYDHTIIDDGDGNPANDIHQVIVGTCSNLHNDSEYDGDNGRWTIVRQHHEEANGYVLVTVSDTEMLMTWKHRLENGVYEDGGDTYFYSTTAINGEKQTVSNYTLSQNYPNPFNPKTVIRYSLPVTGHVDLSIYNILGQKVATLVNKKQSAGNYNVIWNASGLSSGVYLYRLQAGDRVQTKKMIYMK
jgi:predicted phosphodiesterase